MDDFMTMLAGKLNDQLAGITESEEEAEAPAKRELPYVIEPRRPGDVTANYADCTKAREWMGWEAQYDIADMCRDSWNWQSHNPNGYEG